MSLIFFGDVTSVMGLPRNLKSRFYGQPLKKFTSTVLYDQGESSFVLPRNNELASAIYEDLCLVAAEL